MFDYCSAYIEMSSGRDRDKLALIHVQGNEIAPTSNENNEAITNTFLSVLGVQENKGIFEQISNDGHSKQKVQQQ